MLCRVRVQLHFKVLCRAAALVLVQLGVTGARRLVFIVRHCVCWLYSESEDSCLMKLVGQGITELSITIAQITCVEMFSTSQTFKLFAFENPSHHWGRPGLYILYSKNKSGM